VVVAIGKVWNQSFQRVSVENTNHRYNSFSRELYEHSPPSERIPIPGDSFCLLEQGGGLQKLISTKSFDLIHHEAQTDAIQISLMARVLEQLWKPPARRTYSHGFLQINTKYLGNLSPIVETSITEDDMSRSLIHKDTLSTNQLKNTDFYSRVT
jgi:hypothetical protein